MLLAPLVAAAALAQPAPPARLGNDVDETEPLAWEELAALPDPIGFAGPFAGVVAAEGGDALVVAGGANFPDGRPWDGAAKVWHGRVFVLEEPAGPWREATTRLPAPLGYGVSASWNGALVCAGGGDAEAHSSRTFTLSLAGGEVELAALPDLPGPTAFGCGALVGEVLYVAGGLAAPDAPSTPRRVLVPRPLRAAG